MRILISGGRSKFARELCNVSTNLTLIPISRKEMDITELESIHTAIEVHKPDIFLHTAALSRPMSMHNDNPELSIQLNIVGTANCVAACIKHNIKFVYVSTDFVYPGQYGNYSETDPLNPINKYAWSKLGGECACRLYDNSLILRMAMIEKPFPHKKAFIDSYKSCIWYPDAAKMTIALLEKKVTGVVNVGGPKKSIYQFVSEENSGILQQTKQDIAEPVPSDASMDTTLLLKILSNDSTV